MRVTSILLAAGLALFANAQTKSDNSESATTLDAAQASASAAQDEVLKCLNACKPGDVNCTSRCITVPNPNESQVNATNTCVAACPQGNGSPADIQNYSSCVQACIGANYYNPQTGTPQPTGAAGGSSGKSGSGSSGGEGSGSDSGDGKGGSGTGTSGSQASKTGSAAAASSSTGAGGVLAVSGGVMGVVGFLAALVAL